MLSRFLDGVHVFFVSCDVEVDAYVVLPRCSTSCSYDVNFWNAKLFQYFAFSKSEFKIRHFAYGRMRDHS